MSITAYFFFSRFDPATLPQAVVDIFYQNAERAIAQLIRSEVSAIYTGTCRTDGSREVCIQLCNTKGLHTRSMLNRRFVERILPEINLLYAAAGIKRGCSARSIVVKLNDEIPGLPADDSGTKEIISDGGDSDTASRVDLFRSEKPKFSFDRVILPEDTKRELEEAAAVIKYSSIVMGDWGLSDIVSPTIALNFYGPPGTGKTMAADAIADSLGLRVIHASCAEIDNKYHGESPKMVRALFSAAEKENAVLFIDEADSLLSQRIEQITQSADQALNSTRSELLMAIEKHKGVVIFATNLISSYDEAFISRMRCIYFPLPSSAERLKIWRVHLYPTASSPRLKIPLTKNVDIEALAKEYELSGREIREAVKSACFRTAMNKESQVSMATLRSCCEDVLKRNRRLEESLG